MEVTDQEKVKILDAHGNQLYRKSSFSAASLRKFAAPTGVGHEIKRTVGACLGIDFAANVAAWEAIESQVNSWDKAAKFVLRRVGVIAALSCGGGIFAEYVL